uniref:Similarity. Hypothetical start n=1 Tax=Microcystis aeruginosa (strain PCC 7806) TaxID=267872 RepID=A8YCC7_MICA7|nr:unnamed protein product [Microcystis aeruginosa PCC 7806]
MSSHPFGPVKSFDRFCFFLIGGHFHKTKTAHFTRFPIYGQVNATNRAVFSEYLLQVICRDFINQITNVNRHGLSPNITAISRRRSDTTQSRPSGKNHFCLKPMLLPNLTTLSKLA